MEHVYSESDYPLALLSIRIKSKDDLETLIYILKTDPQETEEPEQISEILKVLHYITSDLWWTRCWTFQEDYRASTRMRLLIPHSHSPSLERLKLCHEQLLGSLEGELCVSSARFREQATKYCVAYKEDPQHETTCKNILDGAVKYNVLLEEADHEGEPTIEQSMSPTIFSDVGKRDITDISDMLAVIANCLGYDVRLDTRKLKNRNHSLSLSMLALFLLNGEVLMNGRTDTLDALEDNIFDYLRDQSLRVQTPDIGQKLTFIKGCRFPSVKLHQEGILTFGRLWQLQKVIKVPGATQSPSGGYSDRLNSKERRRLSQLAGHLGSGDCGKTYKTIAGDIENYLRQDKMWKGKFTFSKLYMDTMAREVIKAMEDPLSPRLKLGCLNSGKDRSEYNPYRGVFISEAGQEWTDKCSYVFTAIYTDEDRFKHVSLEVELRKSANRLPRLIIKRWINGLFFFDKKSPVTKVVFPWPEYLRRNYL